MARLPFDPAKMAAAKRAEQQPLLATAPAGDDAITVSQLADRLDAALKGAFPQRVRVVGEVSNFHDRTHWYFDLKDATAVINCVMFASAARKAGFVIEHGQQLVVSGRVEFYAKGGKVSFIADKIEPVGAGALDLAYRKLCDELRELGWFAPERKRPLPIFPRKIAVVTSRSAAALQDVLNTIRKRCPAVGVVLADVRVQGDGAAAEVAAAIRTISGIHASLGVDAVLVTRGGGSKEDLWTFNERIVAEAIVACAIPVVAAIGHETDTTIAELVADERCATPTQAAMRLTPDSAALIRQAETIHRRLTSLMESHLRAESRRIDSLVRRPALAQPGRMVAAKGQELDHARRRLVSAASMVVQRTARRIGAASARLDTMKPTALHARVSTRVETLATRLQAAARKEMASHDPRALDDRLTRGMARLMESRADRIDALDRQLELVAPQRVLDRGFSLTTSADGSLVRSTADVKPGQAVRTRLADGQFESTVSGAATPTTPRKPGRTRRLGEKPGDEGQLDLFGS